MEFFKKYLFIQIPSCCCCFFSFLFSTSKKNPKFSVIVLFAVYISDITQLHHII